MWKQNFAQHILERGKEYYDQDTVTIIDADDERVTAIVHGAKTYQVEIELENSIPIDGECSCPHFDSGNNCKHIAAVMFKLEAENEEVRSKPKTKTTKMSVEQVIADAKESLVREFLTEILEKDSRLFRDFKRISEGVITLESLATYKKQVNTIFTKYQDGYGFIDYHAAGKFYNDIIQFINEEIAQWIKYGHYKIAFEIVNHIALKADRQDIDDSSGETVRLMEECTQLWLEILSNCDIKLKEEAFNWIERTLLENHNIIAQYLESVLFNAFEEDEFLAKKLLLIDTQIVNAQENPDNWYSKYRISNWIEYRLIVMMEAEFSEQEITNYCNGNWEQSVVRKYFVEMCLKNEDYDKVIQVLKESQEIDKEYAGLVAEHSQVLKEIYKQQGMMDEYKQELWNLTRSNYHGSIDLYNELKTVYTVEEWEIEREKAFELYQGRKIICDIYNAEKLYDRLLEAVISHQNLDWVKQYEDQLIPLYSEELLARYELGLRNSMMPTTTRKEYKRLVGIMRRMEKYPDGKARAEALAEEFKRLYPKRGAMKEELQKLW